MGLPASLCVHAERCGRHLAMEHNGDLFNCDHFVEPTHRLGNLMEAPLRDLLDCEQADRFGSDKRDRLPGYCRRCRELRYCHGGCPAHRFDKAPGGEPGLNSLCEGYRLFYRHTLPTFQAMAVCLRSGRPAAEYAQHMTNAEGHSAADLRTSIDRFETHAESGQAGLSLAFRYAFKIPHIRRQRAWNHEVCRGVS